MAMKPSLQKWARGRDLYCCPLCLRQFIASDLVSDHLDGGPDICRRCSSQKTHRRLVERAAQAGTVSGFRPAVSPDACSHCRSRRGKPVALAQALEHPELLPPFARCRKAYCRCTVIPIPGDQS